MSSHAHVIANQQTMWSSVLKNLKLFKNETLISRTAWLRLERWFSLVDAVVRLRLAGTKWLSKSEKEEMVMWVRPGMKMFLSLSSRMGKSWEFGERRSSTWEREGRINQLFQVNFILSFENVKRAHLFYYNFKTQTKKEKRIVLHYPAINSYLFIVNFQIWHANTVVPSFILILGTD